MARYIKVSGSLSPLSNIGGPTGPTGPTGSLPQLATKQEMIEGTVTEPRSLSPSLIDDAIEAVTGDIEEALDNILASKSNINNPEMSALWSDDVTFVNGLLVADKQPPYDRVEEEQSGMVEAGDSVGIYRDTGVMPPTTGGIEIDFIYDGADEFYAGISGNRCYISTTNGKLTGGLGSSSITVIKGITSLINGIKYKARLAWDGTTVNLYLNDSIEYTGAQNGAPNSSLSIFIHALNVGSPANLSNSSIISVAVLDDAGNPTNYWSAANMYYDQIGNNHAVAYGGTPIVTAHPEGDHTMNENGYTLTDIDVYEYSYLTNWDATRCSIVGNSDGWTQIALDGQDDPIMTTNKLEVGGLFGKTLEISYEAYADASVVGGTNNFYIAMTDPYFQYSSNYTISTTPTVYKRTVVHTTTVGQTKIMPRIDFNNNVTGNVYVRNYKIRIIDNDQQPTITPIVPASLTDPTRDAKGNILEYVGRNAHSANTQGYASLCSDSNSGNYTATNPLFISNSAYTLHVRVRLDDISGSDRGLISIGVIPDPSQGDLYTREMSSLRISNDGKIRHLWWYNDVNTSIGTVSADGKYHDIIATYDGVTRYIYLDGVSVMSHVPTESLAVNSGVINIGSERGVLYANNPISRASYYNRALTQEEISGITNDIIPSSGLICFYDGYDLSKDLSGDNLNLTVVGNPTEITDSDGSMRIYEGYHNDGNDIFPLLADGSVCTDGSLPDTSPNIIYDINPIMTINTDGRLGPYLTASNMENETEFQYADIAETPNIIKIGTSSFSIWKNTPTIYSILKSIYNIE